MAPRNAFPPIISRVPLGQFHPQFLKGGGEGSLALTSRKRTPVLEPIQRGRADPDVLVIKVEYHSDKTLIMWR